MQDVVVGELSKRLQLNPTKLIDLKNLSSMKSFKNLMLKYFFSMGMWSTLKLIYNENGVTKGLYRGMSINYLRAIPMVAVSFATYETMKQTLNLDTGMTIS